MSSTEQVIKIFIYMKPSPVINREVFNKTILTVCIEIQFVVIGNYLYWAVGPIYKVKEWITHGAKALCKRSLKKNKGFERRVFWVELNEAPE